VFLVEKTGKLNDATGDLILNLRLDGRDIPQLTDSRGRTTNKAIEVYVNLETFKMNTTCFVVNVQDTSTRGKVLELIKQAGQDGIAFQDIAQELNVSQETVRKYIREFQEREMSITEEGGKGQKPKILRWVDDKKENETAIEMAAAQTDRNPAGVVRWSTIKYLRSGMSCIFNFLYSSIIEYFAIFDWNLELSTTFLSSFAVSRNARQKIALPSINIFIKSFFETESTCLPTFLKIWRF
jgi:transposase-like protein